MLDLYLGFILFSLFFFSLFYLFIYFGLFCLWFMDVPFLWIDFRCAWCGRVEMNLTSIHEDDGSMPGLNHWLKDPALP